MNNQILKKELYQKRIPLSELHAHSMDQFKKISQVGEGTFGKVYKAEYINLNKQKNSKPEIVALKKILTDNEKEGFPITAIREISILKQLNHKNIVKLYEVVTSKPSEKNKNKGNVYLVFEYMEHDISGLTNLKITFPVPAIKCILYQILNGINYLHKKNIIHRDIKSANILLNNKGEIKIADFGLARLINPDPSKIKHYTNRVVTLWYRAPELLLGETNYGTPIDVWSIGCVFAELLTNVPLFKGQKEPDQVEKIFEKLGSPDTNNWPDGINLPLYWQLNPRIKYTYCLKEFFKDNKKVDDCAFDLLNKMVQLDPKKRITIDQALQHDYFTKHLPKMCKPEEIPKIERETHEYQSRKEMNNNKFMNNNKMMAIIGKQNYKSHFIKNNQFSNISKDHNHYDHDHNNSSNFLTKKRVFEEDRK